MLLLFVAVLIPTEEKTEGRTAAPAGYGEGWEAPGPAPAPAAPRAADASILGKVKCLITGALETQPRARQSSGSAPSFTVQTPPYECSAAVLREPPAPRRSQAVLFLLFLSLRGRNPTPTKLIYSFDEGNEQKRKNGRKNKPDLATFVTR